MPKENEHTGETNYTLCIDQFHENFTGLIQGTLPVQRFQEFLEGLDLPNLAWKSRRDRITQDILAMYISADVVRMIATSPEGRPLNKQKGISNFNYYNLLTFAKDNNLISEEIYDVKMLSAKILHLIFTAALSESGLQNLSTIFCDVRSLKIKVGNENKDTARVLNSQLQAFHRQVSHGVDIDAAKQKKLRNKFFNGIRDGKPLEEIAIEVMGIIIEQETEVIKGNIEKSRLDTGFSIEELLKVPSAQELAANNIKRLIRARLAELLCKVSFTDSQTAALPGRQQLEPQEPDTESS